jgi:hypothetical protein
VLWVLPHSLAQVVKDASLMGSILDCLELIRGCHLCQSILASEAPYPPKSQAQPSAGSVGSRCGPTTVKPGESLKAGLSLGASAGQGLLLFWPAPLNEPSFVCQAAWTVLCPRACSLPLPSSEARWKDLDKQWGTKLKEHDMESRRRMLELVAATEKQLVAQGHGWQGTEEEGPGASMEMRAGDGQPSSPPVLSSQYLFP